MTQVFVTAPQAANADRFSPEEEVTTEREPVDVAPQILSFPMVFAAVKSTNAEIQAEHAAADVIIAAVPSAATREKLAVAPPPPATTVLTVADRGNRSADASRSIFQ